MQFIVGTTTDPSDEDGTARELAELKAAVSDAADALGLQSHVSTSNLGLGADWIVSVVEIAALTGAAIFAIPEAHKRIRESVEECRRMRRELVTLMNRIRGRRPVVRNPVELLYLTALERALMETDASELKFISSEILPVPSELTNGFVSLQHHLFVFRAGHEFILIAVDSDVVVLWVKRFASTESREV